MWSAGEGGRMFTTHRYVHHRQLLLATDRRLSPVQRTGDAVAKFSKTRAWDKVPQGSTVVFLKLGVGESRGSIFNKKPAWSVQPVRYSTGVWQTDTRTQLIRCCQSVAWITFGPVQVCCCIKIAVFKIICRRSLPSFCEFSEFREQRISSPSEVRSAHLNRAAPGMHEFKRVNVWKIKLNRIVSTVYSVG